jgi:hypothetical protein
MTQPKMNLHGVSICPAGEENYERYKDFRGKWLYQYDYRDTDGELFTVVMPTLTECRMRRDKWLQNKILDNAELQEIRQGGKTILHSTDGVSIPVIFNNLTGKNSKTAEDYSNYIQYVALPQMGFEYGEIELIADGVTVKTGTIRQSL